jgi:alpha-beta hydrolase superfamily lysophospholipase
MLYNKLDHPELTALFFPSAGPSTSPCPASAEDVCLDIGSGNTLNCRFYFADTASPVLFYYPAASGSTETFDPIAESYRKQGLNVFLASYRGCGSNNGSPSLAAMFGDSETLFQLATRWLTDKGYTGALFVMGQSLGSICAIDTVLNNAESVKGLIIESAICSTASFLEAMGAGSDLGDIEERDGFNNVEKIAQIKNPTLIFHGARDQLVAIAEAEKLQAASGAKTKQFFVIPGAAHHTVSKTGGDLYSKAIKQFTDTVCGVNTWRQKRRSHKRPL